MFKTRQAADNISEDQILNFLVNELTEEFTVDFGGNADIDAETLFEVLVGACADGTSVSSLCKTSEDSPHENTVLYHLRDKFELGSVEGIGNALLRKDVLDSLPEHVDLHLRPYYGDEERTPGAGTAARTDSRLSGAEGVDGTQVMHKTGQRHLSQAESERRTGVRTAR